MLRLDTLAYPPTAGAVQLSHHVYREIGRGVKYANLEVKFRGESSRGHYTANLV
jgi:hypothetical protein